MSIIDIKNLIFEYFRRDNEGDVTDVIKAVNDVSLNVVQGDFVAIVGHNGSGKSTLAKHINGLLKASSGSVMVNGLDASDEDNVWEIRKNVGMVFQNPDNQIVGTVVEEDVAFGPENIGVPIEEIWNRVLESLEAVSMSEYATSSPNKLSGGQKQKVAIAGVLAMEPNCIILDESTAMLDPEGRRELLETVTRLNKEKNITIILITHYMEEVLYANKVYVMNEGKLVMNGNPVKVFSKYEELYNIGLEVPDVSKIAHILYENGININKDVLTSKELINQIVEYKKTSIGSNNRPKRRTSTNLRAINPTSAIILDNVDYTYNIGTNDEKTAIKNVSLAIGKGEFVGIVGHTGSGKSTLIQHLNGLLLPTRGSVYFNGDDITDKKFDISKLRENVGLVFQYPEDQLFGQTVFEDVYFGPSNMNLTQLESQKRAFEAIAAVGLSDELYDTPPFQLSGGQKRRVAIAGVLAMGPEYLVLDEPGAGLDPKGKRELYELLEKLRKEKNMTIIVVSHSMEEISNYADRIVVLNKGEVAFDNTPEKVFSKYEELENMHLAAPISTYIMIGISDMGVDVSTNIYTVEDAAREIIEELQ